MNKRFILGHKTILLTIPRTIYFSRIYNIHIGSYMKPFVSYYCFSLAINQLVISFQTTILQFRLNQQHAKTEPTTY